MYSTLSHAVFDFHDFQKSIVGVEIEHVLHLIVALALQLGGCITMVVLYGSLYIFEVWSICNFFWERVVLS